MPNNLTIEDLQNTQIDEWEESELEDEIEKITIRLAAQRDANGHPKLNQLLGLALASLRRLYEFNAYRRLAFVRRSLDEMTDDLYLALIEETTEEILGEDDPLLAMEDSWPSESE